MAYPPCCYRAAEHVGSLSVLLEGVQGKGHNPQVWKYVPARRIKNVSQILQIQEISGLHTHQSPMTQFLATIIGLAAIAVLVVDGTNRFFNYFAEGLKGAPDHPQLLQARSFSSSGRATLQRKSDLE